MAAPHAIAWSTHSQMDGAASAAGVHTSRYHNKYHKPLFIAGCLGHTIGTGPQTADKTLLVDWKPMLSLGAH